MFSEKPPVYRSESSARRNSTRLFVFHGASVWTDRPLLTPALPRNHMFMNDSNKHENGSFRIHAAHMTLSERERNGEMDVSAAIESMSEDELRELIGGAEKALNRLIAKRARSTLKEAQRMVAELGFEVSFSKAGKATGGKSLLWALSAPSRLTSLRNAFEKINGLSVYTH